MYLDGPPKKNDRFVFIGGFSFDGRFLLGKTILSYTMSRFVGTCVIPQKVKIERRRSWFLLYWSCISNHGAAPHNSGKSTQLDKKTFHAASVTTGDRFRDASPIDRKQRSQILTRTANRSERLRRKKMPTRQLFSQRTC